ncbi:unnamed protein product [marine sediment metagenome]|uniref:AMP-dependent synthetase/ligase domain-containing protein n=1 Tax=marine sediment metagenome TaxID=412755 RepID=X1SER3_9ZZZZ
MRLSVDRPWFKFWPEGVPRHIDYPEIPLFEFLSNAARKYPNNVAFSCRERSLTYAELDILTSKLALGLRELGIKKEDSVALFLPNSPEFVTGYYGILKVGGIVSPVNPLHKEQELKRQLNDSGATAIITNGNLYRIVKAVRSDTGLKTIILTDSERPGEAVSLEEILVKCPSTPPALDLNPKEQIAAIEYTGGTTGFPKGAMLTHYNLVANAIQNASWFGWNSRDIIIGLLPAYHSWGACTCVNSPIYVGARVILLPRLDVDELLMTIEREKATVLYGAASMFISLINNPPISKP